MEEVYSIYLIVVIVVTLLTATLLVTRVKKTPSPQVILAGFLLLLAYPPFLTLLLHYGLLFKVPHLYRTGYLALFLALPLPYLYVRGMTTGPLLRRMDAIHFLPVVIYLIDLLPFFLLSGEEKVASIRSGDVGKRIIELSESWYFSAGFYTVGKYLLGLYYWILQFRLVFALTRNLETKGSDMSRWLWVFVLFQLFMMVPPLHLFMNTSMGFQWIYYASAVGGLTALVAAALYFFPNVLYGTLFPPPGQATQADHQVLSPERSALIREKIADHLAAHRSFLQHQYTLQKLAIELGIPATYISSVINEREGKNFNDYINAMRIEFFLENFSAPEFSNYTLEAMAKASGFNNRNTFTQSFKKYTGKNPSEYRRSLKSGR